MSAPTNFTIFTQLPDELQMTAWSHAATPFGPLKIDAAFLGEATFVPPRLALQWATSPNFVRNDFLQLTAIRARELLSRRRVLMNTCVMARQAVLECWRGEIKAIVVTGPDEGVDASVKRVLQAK